MAPVLMKRVSFLDYPVDFNLRFKGKPLFGKNKTYRGFFFGIFFAVLISLLQEQLYTYTFFQSLSLIDYGTINIFLFGFLIGFGVLFGDLLESFIKRRFHKKPGERFFPWDQLDGLIGGLIFLSPLYWPGWTFFLLLIVFVLVLHIAINHLGHYLGLQESKW